MERFGKIDTRFQGSKLVTETKSSIEVERDEPIHFHNPSYLIYETHKSLAITTKKKSKSNQED